MQSVCFCSSPQTFHLPLLSWLWGLSERIHVKYFQQCSTQWVLSTLAIGVVVVVSVLLFLPNVILTYTFHLVHFSALTQKPVFVAKQLSGQFSLWARPSILCTRPQAAFVSLGSNSLVVKDSVAGTRLSTLYIYLILCSQLQKVDLVIPISSIRKPRLREGKSLREVT